MSQFENLQYISRSGLRAHVRDPFDDPYLGRPKSSLGLRVMQDGPCGIGWTYQGRMIEKIYATRIEVELDQTYDLLVVIGHGGATLGDYERPNNGAVFRADGLVHRRIMVPPRIARPDAAKLLAPGATRVLVPEALTAVDRFDHGIAISLAYLDRSWDETRRYDSMTGEWGEITGQYRVI